MPRRIALLFVLAVFAAAALAQQPISVFSRTVPLDPRDPAKREIGELEYRGGVALRSTDARFGGFSGLHVSSDGASVFAISDRGS